jgi:toxin HigB-1
VPGGVATSSLHLFTFILYRYTINLVIRSFACRDTESIFNGIRSRKFQTIERVAYRKLIQLHVAQTLNDLRSPGNSLEALKGNRAGQHAIRINDQYRLCFLWKQPDAYDVAITDYH